MGSKVLLGILLGVIIGSLSTIFNSKRYASEFPLWFSTPLFNLLTSLTCITIFGWVIYTFVKYPIQYGFMAFGEIALGAFFSGFLPYNIKTLIVCISFPSSIILIGML